MSQDALFDSEPYAAEGQADLTGLSPDRRRTVRQSVAIELGQHPLALAVGPLVLLGDNPKVEPYMGEGKAWWAKRCGNCQFRGVFGHHDRTYGKCTYDEPARMSHGAATDCRAWWPACTDYQPR